MSMSILIGRADNPAQLPDVSIPMSGDPYTARETAVYLAVNMKIGFTVSLQGDEMKPIYIHSGQPLTAAEYEAVHDGKGGHYAGF